MNKTQILSPESLVEKIYRWELWKHRLAALCPTWKSEKKKGDEGRLHMALGEMIPKCDGLKSKQEKIQDNPCKLKKIFFKSN